MNISANSKPNSKIFLGVNQGPIWGQFMKKNRGKKSLATVPLMSTFFREKKDFFRAKCFMQELSYRQMITSMFCLKKHPFQKTSSATKCPHHKTSFSQNVLTYKTSLPTKHPSTKCTPPPRYKISTCSQQHLVHIWTIITY
jgi:hypothetical protein